MKFFKIIIPVLALSLQNTVQSKYVADEVNSVLYDLSISSFPVNADATSQEQFSAASESSAGSQSNLNDFVAVGNKFGQKYYCRFPTFVERTPGIDEGLLDPPLAQMVTSDEIRDVLDPLLKGSCFKYPNARERNAGWWTYEFCYKDGITQYHLENEKITGETIYLGHFESEKDWSTAEAVAELGEKQKKALYHTHLYTNGTPCEVTNQFRRTEVRFVCDEELLTGAYLHSVDEPESCEYILTVHAKALCRLPAFLPIDRKPTPLKIECQPALSAPEYDKYLEAKQAEEARKEAEAARKKEEQQLKMKMDEEKKKYQKPEPPKSSLKETVLGLDGLDTLLGAADAAKVKSKKDTPVLEILGKRKSRFLKKQAAAEEQQSKDGVKQPEETKAATSDDDDRNIGGAGTIEFEYMTHWLEQQLEEMALNNQILEAEEELDDPLEELSEVEQYAVDLFKRKTRRVGILAAFQQRLEVLVDDLYESIELMFDKRIQSFTRAQKKRAKVEIKEALTIALVNLLDEVEATEEDMDLLGENPGATGLPALQRLREMLEGRAEFMRQFEESGLSAVDFVKKKIAEDQLKPSTATESGASQPDATEKPASVDSATEAPPGVAKTKLPPPDSADDPLHAVKEKEMMKWLNQDKKKPVDKVDRSVTGEVNQGMQSSTSALDAKESGNIDQQTAAGDDAKGKTKSKLRRETESQLGNILEDVERELTEEGVFDDLNDEEIAEVKTEAFRSLAKTLTNLLEKLDDAERDVDAAIEQLEEDKKATFPTHVSSSPKRMKKAKETEKRLELWRKLVEGIDDEQKSDTTDATERKPLGKIQVKRGDSVKSKSGKDDGFKVRVSTVKRKESKGDTEASSDTEKLERRIAEKLKDAGFDTQGRPVQVKIITNLDMDENGDFAHSLTEEESEQFTNVLYAILSGTSTEQTAENRRLRALEDNYNFGTDSESGDGSKREKSTPMETIVVGGRGP